MGPSLPPYLLPRSAYYRWLRRTRFTLSKAVLSLALTNLSVVPLTHPPVLNPHTPAATIIVTFGAMGQTAGDGCSLVEAIINANNDNTSGSAECVAGSGADIIDMPYESTLTYNTLFGTGALLPNITANLTIDGNTTLIQRVTTDAARLINVTGGTLTLRETTLIAGYSDMGGAVNVGAGAGLVIQDSTIGNSSAIPSGGGIFGGAGSTITVTNGGVVSGNTAVDGGGIFSDGGTIIVGNGGVVQGNLAGARGGNLFVTNGGTLTVRNSLVSEGMAFGQGGALFSQLSSTTLDNATISGNSANLYGSGAVFVGGSATITSSSIIGNSGNFHGGAIATNGSATVTIEGSTLQNNSAGNGQGGAMFLIASTVTLTDSTVSGNSAMGEGGALYMREGDLTVNNSTIRGNSAYTAGGALSLWMGNLTVNNSTMSGNTANGVGGAISLRDNSVTVTNSTLSGNTASGGGGVYLTAGAVALTHSTITGNSAAIGGGTATYQGVIDLNRSIVSGNSATNAGDEIYNYTSAGTTANDTNILGSSASTNAQAFSDFTPGATDITATSDGSTPTPPGSILAPLANNSGTTETHALVAGSPAIDVAATGPATDQREQPRPIDGDGTTSGSEFDAGSFELGLPTAVENGELRAESGGNNRGVWAILMVGVAASVAWVRRRIKRN